MSLGRRKCAPVLAAGSRTGHHLGAVPRVPGDKSRSWRWYAQTPDIHRWSRARSMDSQTRTILSIGTARFCTQGAESLRGVRGNVRPMACLHDLCCACRLHLLTRLRDDATSTLANAEWHTIYFVNNAGLHRVRQKGDRYAVWTSCARILASDSFVPDTVTQAQ